MGSAQSVLQDQTSQQEQMSQRLRGLHVRENSKQDVVDQDYIHIEKEGDGKLYFNGTSLKPDAAKLWEKTLLAEPKNRLALSALLTNPISAITTQNILTLPDQQLFNTRIPLEGTPVPNQNNSGRCWLFATTNVFRVAVMKKYNLKAFELSQQYPFFWDKMERANWALTQFVETADQDLSSRIVQELLKQPITDGGQWDMASNLIQKYGLVPQSLYPDAYSATDSTVMDSILTLKLREDCLKLRALKNDEKTTADAVQDAKSQMMQEIHTIITLMLGPPPKPDETFTWEYYDADNKYHCVKKTPLDYVHGLFSSTTAKLTRQPNLVNFTEWFSLVNDPRHDYLTHLTVDRLGNVVEGRPVSYINVDATTMKNAAISMIKQGYPVWFGCDVGQSAGGPRGLMDTKLWDWTLALNTTFGMNKAQRMDTQASAMGHAMTLTAVHIEDGKPVRWRVMNSYGLAEGEDGFWLMMDDWMTEYCYQIVTNAAHVPKEVMDVAKQEPKVLPLWDPMGTLA